MSSFFLRSHVFQCFDGKSVRDMMTGWRPRFELGHDVGRRERGKARATSKEKGKASDANGCQRLPTAAKGPGRGAKKRVFQVVSLCRPKMRL